MPPTLHSPEELAAFADLLGVRLDWRHPEDQHVGIDADPDVQRIILSVDSQPVAYINVPDLLAWSSHQLRYEFPREDEAENH